MINTWPSCFNITKEVFRFSATDSNVVHSHTICVDDAPFDHHIAAHFKLLFWTTKVPIASNIGFKFSRTPCTNKKSNSYN